MFGLDDIAIIAGIYGARYLYNKYLKVPGARQKIPGLQLPRTEEGTPIPMWWGRTRVTSPVLLDAFRFTADNEEGLFWYRGVVLMSLGIPQDYFTSVQLSKMWVGDKAVPVIPNSNAGWSPLSTHSQGIVGKDLRLVDPYPFESGGGIAGRVELFGSDAALSASLPGSRFLEAFVDYGSDQTLLPDYKNQIKVALTGWVEDSNFGNPPTKHAGFSWTFGIRPDVAPISFEVQPIAIEADPPAYYEIVETSGGVNPMGVLLDILTGGFGKCGIPEASIDLVALEAAATTLNEESHGYSRFVPDANEARDLVDEILEQARGVMYQEPTTGKYVVALIRDDYEIGDVISFSEADVIGAPTLEVPTAEGLYNTVRLTWTDPERDYQPTVAFAQDAALVADAGKVRALELSFPGVCDAGLADVLAARELKSVTSPLKRISLNLNRRAGVLRPGDVFKLTYPDWNGMTDKVFRVTRVNLGQLRNGRVAVEGVEDQFHIATAMFDRDDLSFQIPDVEVRDPFPLLDRYVDEMPRFLQLYYGIADYSLRQHLMYFANPDDIATGFRAYVELGSSAMYDIGWRSFGTRGKVSTTAVSREDGPYDTTTGITVDLGMPGAGSPQLANASFGNISVGANLAFIGNELIAFETATDQGSNIWLLENVWRGCCDTVPQDHPIGTPIFFIPLAPINPQISTDGIFPWALADVVSVRLQPRKGTLVLDLPQCETDEVTIAERVLKPLPASDFEADASNVAIASHEDEGLDLTWKTREMSLSVVKRPSAANDTLQDTGTVYKAYGWKDGFDTDVELYTAPSAVAEVTNDDEMARVSMAAAGHGELEIRLRSINSDAYESWQDAFIPITAPRWRNLVVNHDFGDDPSTAVGWDVTNGQINSGAGIPLGWWSSGQILEGDAAGDLVAFQDIHVERWLEPLAIDGASSSIVAVLDFYAKNQSADADDEAQVVLTSRDSGWGVVATETYAWTAQPVDAWRHYTLTLPVEADVVGFRISLEGRSVGGGDTAADIGFANVTLRLGQVSDQLLSNPSFEDDTAGVPDDWTIATGSWIVGDATHNPDPYEDEQFAMPDNTGASAELYQESNLPAGFEYGTAVLEFARLNTNSDADDTGEVILEARAAGGAVVATATTGAEATTTANWLRRRLTLDIPDTATHFRLRLIATRVGDAGSPDVGFDDFDLRIHKGLDPDVDIDADFSTPATSPMPDSLAEWQEQLPDVTAPAHGLWNGTAAEEDGYAIADAAPHASPFRLADSSQTALTNIPFIGPWDGETCLQNCYEFVRDGEHDFASFGSGGPGKYPADVDFSALAVIKIDEIGFATACGVFGRRSSSRGWGVTINASGQVVATIYGSGATIAATSSATVHDGCPHEIGIAHDAAAQLLYVIVDGTRSAGTSTATLGTISYSTSTFRIGRTRTTDDSFPGQIARVYLWWDHVLSTDELDAMWSHGDDGTGLLDEATSDTGGTVAVAVTDGDGGMYVARFPDNSIPYAWDRRLHAYGALDSEDVSLGGRVGGDWGGETGWGLALSAQATNLVASGNPTFVADGGVTMTENVRDVEGLLHAVEITDDNSAGIYVDVPLGAGADVWVSFFLHYSGSGTPWIKLFETDETELEDIEVEELESGWNRVDVKFTTWTDATPNGRIRIFANSAGTPVTIKVSTPFVVHQDATSRAFPLCLPPRGQTVVGDATVTFTDAIGLQWNYEGEIRVDGVFHGLAQNSVAELVTAENGVDDDDLRRVYAERPGATTWAAKFEHYDGAGASGSGEITANDITDPFQIRGRWARAALFEDPASFADLRVGNAVIETPDVARAATWTPGTVALEAPILGSTVPGDEEHGGPNAILTRVRLTARELGVNVLPFEVPS